MLKKTKLGLIVSILALSCNIDTTNIPKSTISKTNEKETVVSQSNNLKFIEKFKNKKKYTGDIDISINTDIYNKDKDSKVFKVLSESKSFSIESVPQGSIVFQETYNLEENRNLNITKNFNITDTTKRYTLYVKRNDEKGRRDFVRTTINVNGQDVIRNRDFKCGDEATNDSLLLNANNSLSLKVNGKKNSSFTIMVIEGGQAGIIRKRKNPLGEHESNDKHIKSNDTNIFDPNDTSSLGQLEAYKESTTIKGLSDISGKDVSAVGINDLGAINIETGVLVLRFKDTIGLDTFKQLYDAKEISSFDDTYILKVNLDKISISDMQGLVENFNDMIPENITKMEFSSIKSMKTFAIFADFLTKYPNMLKGIEFNILGEMRDAVPDIGLYGHIFELKQGTPPIEFKDTVLNSWESQATRLNKAWDYTKGEGVKVAAIDGGSFYFNHPEMRDASGNSRYVFDPDSLQVPNNFLGCHPNVEHLGLDFASGKLSNTLTAFGFDISCQNLNHSHYAAMVGFASDLNNKYPATGVSPRSLVVPYRKWTTGEWAEAVYRARTVTKVDIIYMPMGLTVNVGDILGSFISSGAQVTELISGNFTDESSLIEQIKKATREGKGIPFISSVDDHNGTFDIHNPNFLSPLLDYPAIFAKNIPGAIAAGAVAPYNISQVEPRYNTTPLSSGQVYNSFKTNPVKLRVPDWSAYGDKVIYVPGENIFVSSHSNFDSPDINKKFMPFGGTSASTPYLAGVIALMKSINPLLTASEIEKILETSSVISILPNSEMMKNPSLSSPKMIDVPKAIESVMLPPTIQNVNYSDNILSINGNNLFVQPSASIVFEQISTREKFSYVLPESNSTLLGGKKLSISARELRAGSGLLTNNQGVPVSLPTGNYKILFQSTNGSSNESSNIFIQINKWTMRIFNVDDTSYAQVNLNNIEIANYANDSGIIDITRNVIENENKIDFKTYNTSGGYTWGFQLFLNDTLIWYREEGQIGVFGANNNDQTKTNRYVFDTTLKFDPSTGSLTSERNNLDGLIAFQSDRDNSSSSEIYKMREDGSQQTRVTNSSNYDYNIVWSPDKSKIAFTSYNSSTDKDFVHIINANGTEDIEISNVEGHDPAWTSDGSKIVFEGHPSDYSTNKKHDIYLVNSDGTDLKNITNSSYADESYPIFSPDTNDLLFVSDEDGSSNIYLYKIENKFQRKITSNTDDKYEPKYSPDGANIIYTAYPQGSDVGNIWLMNRVGGDNRKITFEDTYKGLWSPDGNKIAYQKWNTSSSNRQLKVTQLSNLNTITLTSTNSYDSLNSWLLDASGVLFTSERDGDEEIYKVDWNGSNLRQITFNNADDWNATEYFPRNTFTIQNAKDKTRKVKAIKPTWRRNKKNRH